MIEYRATGVAGLSRRVNTGWHRLWSAVHDWPLWVWQGCPRDEPVVIRRGRIRACPHGFALVSDWGWTVRWMRPRGRMIDLGDLLDKYTVRYPVERVDALDACTLCRATGGVTA